MNISEFFKKNWIHFAAIGIFLIVSSVYFSLQLQGNGLKQHDIEQFIGSSHEIIDYREHNNGEEPLWTNSMFGGMPAAQISVIHSGNWFSTVLYEFLGVFKAPMGIVLLYMLCAYAMFSMMKVNRWVAIFGALSMAFLSYNVIILQAGHNTKGIAIAFMAPVLGAFIMTLRRNWKIGALLSTVFMSFEMAANHLQITYYLGFILLFVGITELVKAFQEKRVPDFLKGVGALVVGYGLALIINAGNIVGTNDYAKHTIRGGNDLTITADGSSNASNSTEGLDRDYVTQYSYGKGESFTLISPYVKGGGTMAFGDSPFVSKVENSDLTPAQQNTVMQSLAYWGDQPSTSGPVYIGVILVLLALLGMVYLKDPSKWALLGVSILALMLAWGKNYMGLTNWFLDHVPGYNKFRAVTIIMVVIELCLPVIAILFLDKLIKERDQIKANIKPFYITVGAFFVFVVALRVIGIDNVYLSQNERDPANREKQEMNIFNQLMSEDPEQLKANGIDINNPQQIQQVIDNNMAQYDEQLSLVQTVRKDVFKSSMNRTILFSLLAIGLLFLLVKTSIQSIYVIIGLGLFSFIDVVSVTRNYLNNEDEGNGYKYWAPRLETSYPMIPSTAEMQILENETAQNKELKSIVEAGRKEGIQKSNELGASGLDARRIENAYIFAALNRNTNFRVFDYTGGFNSARASYFNKSLGGYHGAKLRAIQNLAEFHIYKSNNQVLNMLNVKYLIQQGQGDLMANPNPGALGNAWLVKSLKPKTTRNDEILALGSQLHMTNINSGVFLVNGNPVREIDAFGSEKLQYVVAGEKDTLDIPLSNGMQKGIEVVFVRDINGKTNLIMKQGFDLDTTKSFQGFVAFKVVDNFDASTEAIVSKEDVGAIGQLKYSGEGSIREVKYAPNLLKYSVDVKQDEFAVFSEIYYPYWKAYIDGKEVPIYRVNYLLRGLKLPKGKYTVEFKYEDPIYSKYNSISRIVSWLLVLLSAGLLYFSFRKKKAVEAN
jgi:hypothetical protein